MTLALQKALERFRERFSIAANPMGIRIHDIEDFFIGELTTCEREAYERGVKEGEGTKNGAQRYLMGYAAAMEEVREKIEGMMKACNNEVCKDPDCLLRAYNQALSDLLARLEEKKN